MKVKCDKRMMLEQWSQEVWSQSDHLKTVKPLVITEEQVCRALLTPWSVYSSCVSQVWRDGVEQTPAEDTPVYPHSQLLQQAFSLLVSLCSRFSLVNEKWFNMAQWGHCLGHRQKDGGDENSQEWTQMKMSLTASFLLFKGKQHFGNKTTEKLSHFKWTVF